MLQSMKAIALFSCLFFSLSNSVPQNLKSAFESVAERNALPEALAYDEAATPVGVALTSSNGALEKRDPCTKTPYKAPVVTRTLSFWFLKEYGGNPPNQYKDWGFNWQYHSQDNGCSGSVSATYAPWSAGHVDNLQWEIVDHHDPNALKLTLTASFYTKLAHGVLLNFTALWHETLSHKGAQWSEFNGLTYPTYDNTTWDLSIR